LPNGMDYLGKGLELSNLSYLGHMAQKNGYDTLAMQASNRRSYRVDAVSHLAGFKQYYGAEDMPEVEELDEGHHPNTGTFDYNMFDFYHKKINTLKEPFVSFAFTTTTHSEYHVPSKKFEKFKHGLKSYNGKMNTFAYTDNSIKRFMQKCEKEPWFDNTIFIFTSDHGRGDAHKPESVALRGEFEPLPSIEHFRIPLIIYAPKIFKAKEIETLGSHVDIFPTIADMLGWKGDLTVLGNSLFDKDVKERFVLVNAGQTASFITDESYLIYNFKNILETDSKNVDDIFKEYKAVDTAQSYLLDKNRWYKPWKY